MQRGARVLTRAADEKLLIAVVGLAWLGIRLMNADVRTRRRADHLARTTAAAAALTYVAKCLVDKERPDHRVVGWRRHGVPRSVRPYNSFPSGHVVHLAAIGAGLARSVPHAWKKHLWLTMGGLGMTRLVLLAHWPTDLASSFAIGIGLEAALHRLLGPAGVTEEQAGPRSGIARHKGSLLSAITEGRRP